VSRAAVFLPASPYKGLVPFEDSELDALFFFGRERETGLVTANLIAARLTVLYGPIGVSGTYPRFIGAILRRVSPAYAASNPYLVKMGSLVTTETMLVVGLLIGGFLAAQLGADGAQPVLLHIHRERLASLLLENVLLLGTHVFDLPAEVFPQVADEVRGLDRAYKALGCPLEYPFMMVSFLSLGVIPALRLTNRGVLLSNEVFQEFLT